MSPYIYFIVDVEQLNLVWRQVVVWWWCGGSVVYRVLLNTHMYDCRRNLLCVLGNLSLLYEHLQYITEVTGYVKVVRSRFLKNLSFFKRLQHIGGKWLDSDK